MDSSIKFVHFSDTHLGLETHGRVNPKTGRSTRLEDILRCLDSVVERAIDESVDLALIPGDVFHRENPHPTEETEFAMRLNRLVHETGAEVVIVLGNHDYPSASGRAAAVEIFPALNIEKIHIARSPKILLLPIRDTTIQVVCMPWTRKSTVTANESPKPLSALDVQRETEDRMVSQLRVFIEKLNASNPAVLVGHMAVRNASYSGTERSTLDMSDPTMPLSELTQGELAYAALGHIHRFQDMNRGKGTPVVYAGSIERVDFSEEREEKGFVIGEIYPEDGGWKCKYDFVKTPARRFVTIELEAGDGGITEEDIAAALGNKGVEGAVVKVRCTVREVDVSINEKGIRNALKGAFSVRVERILDSAGRATRAVELTKELDPVSALEKYIQHKPELKNISNEMIQCARRLIKEVEDEN